MFFFYPLADYVFFLTEKQLNAKDAVLGYLLELAIKDYFGLPLVISEAGHNDLWRVPIHGALRVVESKQNGGDFRSLGSGNSYIFYAVFVDKDKDLRGQFGYLMEMRTFRSVGESLGHIRHTKQDSKGNYKTSLQTLYVYSRDDYLGKKAFKLADAWESCGAETFKEFFVI